MFQLTIPLSVVVSIIISRTRFEVVDTGWLKIPFIYLLTMLLKTIMMVTTMLLKSILQFIQKLTILGENIDYKNTAFEYDYTQARASQ